MVFRFMKRNIRKHKKCVMIFLSALICLSSSITALARENAYLATLYDDVSNSWRTSVIISNRQVERLYVTGKFFGGPAIEYLQTPEAYNNFKYTFYINERTGIVDNSNWSDYNASMLYLGWHIPGAGESNNGSLEISLREENDLGANLPLSQLNYMSESAVIKTTSSPLTFPSCINDCKEADINRAYQISEMLGNSINDALRFLNNGESYTNYSEDLFKELTQKLLCCSATNQSSQNTINNNGHVYDIYYNFNDGCCYITDKTDNKQEKFPFRAEKGYIYDDELTQQARQEIATQENKVLNEHPVFSYDNSGTNGYYYARTLQDAVRSGSDVNYLGLSNVDKKRTFNAYGDDNTTNHLSINKRYVTDTKYITWWQMVYEAKLLETQGVTYSTQGDLLEVTGTEAAITHFVKKLLNMISDLLGNYSVSDLVFNEGLRGSKAFYHGLFYRSWYDNIATLYLISATLAISIISIAIILRINGRNLETLNSIPFSRYNLMQSAKDIILVLLFIAVTLPLANIIFNIGDSFLNVFKSFSSTARCRSLTHLSVTTGTLAAVIVQIAYFIITMYLNIVYLIRGIVIAILIAFAPLFIICMAFPGKLRGITSSWISELVGNYLIQIVHALVLAFLMSTNVGLRGIEAIVFMACLIPLTNLFKGLFTRGGGLAEKLSGTLTSGGTQAGLSLAGAATDAVSGGSGGLMNGVGGQGRKHEAPGYGYSKTINGQTANGESGVGRVKFSGTNLGGNKGFANNLRQGSYGVGRTVNTANRVMKGVGGAGEMLLGAGMFTALAGSNPEASAVSSSMMRHGAGSIAEGVSEVGYGVGAGIDRATHIPQERIDTKMNNAVGEYHPDAVPNSNSSGISDFNKSGNQIRQEYAKVRTMPNTKILHSNANGKDVFAYNPYGYKVKKAEFTDASKNNISYTVARNRRMDSIINKKNSSDNSYTKDLHSMGFTSIEQKSDGSYKVTAPNSLNLEKINTSSKGVVVGSRKIEKPQTTQKPFNNNKNN